jgi:hypothetical protein
MRAILSILFVFAAAAQADEFTVSFTESTLTGTPGDVLEFDGTLTNNTSSTVFINNDSFTFQIPGALDDSLFLNNAPFTLGPMATSTSFAFFDVTIPGGQLPGDYTGAFTLQGGSDDNAMDNLGVGSFQVDIPAGTPEPASFLLLATVAAWLWITKCWAANPRRSRA